jgi:hypothetical protein
VLLREVEPLRDVRELRERAETSDRHVGAPQASREREALPEMALSVLEPPSPDLDDPEVHQRERAQGLVGREVDPAVAVGGSEDRAGRLYGSVEVAARARPFEPHHREQHLEARHQPPACGRGEPLRQRKVRVRHVEPARGQVVGRGQRGQRGVRPQRIRRELPEQPPDHLSLSVQQQAEPVLHEEVAGVAPVASRLRVPDRLGRGAVRRMPTRRRDMQRLDLLGGHFPAQLHPQEVGEQGVAAEPRTAGVDREDERVRVLELVQGTFGARLAGDQLGERAVDPLEDAGAEQQAAHARRPAGEDLVVQVLGDRPIRAGEAAGETVGVGVAHEAQCGEAQAGRPAFRPIVEQIDALLRQVDAGRGHQLARLAEGERQLRAPDLGHLAQQPQSMEPQMRDAAREQQEPRLRNIALEQRRQRVERDPRLELMEIVDDEQDGVGLLAQRIGEPLGELVEAVARLGERELARQRAARAQRLRDREPEARGVPLATRHPGPGHAPRVPVLHP